MNNEDPADPSVHEQRELPEPLYTAEELAQHMENDCMLVGWDDVPAMLRSQATEIARLRETLNFIATHFSSDWPEQCQSNVLAARHALTQGPNA
jgi:hypothetical protein